MTRIVLSLCDLSGVMVQPWLDTGHECWLVDIQHPPGLHRDGLLVRVGADLLTWLPPRVEYTFCAAFPPCTHLAVSGARWFAGKGLTALAAGVGLVARCAEICEWTGAAWLLENPVSTLSTYWRKPDHTFDPCDYGDGWTKKTCLWTGGGFVMPPKRRVPVTDPGKIHRMAPGPDRANLRSLTPPGFARAVYEANGTVPLERAA